MNRSKLSEALIVLITAVTVLATLPRPLRAQLDNGRVFISYGHVRMDMDKFNQRLFDRDVADIESSFNSFGAGFYSFVSDRWCLGGELHFLMKNSRTVGVYKADISGASGGLNLGYTVYRLGGLNIRPQFGVSGGSVNIKIHALNPPSSGSPLGEGRDREELSSVQTVLSAMLAIDYLWPLRQTAEGTGYGVHLGMQIGYQASPWQSDWESTGIDIFDNPQIKYQGPRLNFSLGFGWGLD